MSEVLDIALSGEIDHSIPERDKREQYITPRYVTESRDELLSFVNDYLGFLGKTRRNLLRRAIEQPKNGLFNALLPHLYNEESGAYICLSQVANVLQRNQTWSKRLVESGEYRLDEIQQNAAYFTNAMRLLKQEGFRLHPDDDTIILEYEKSRPSSRVTNSRIFVFTAEFDLPKVMANDAKEVHRFLNEQVGWALSTGKRGTDSIIGQIYRHLCINHDFRGIEMVWSGNKSCHLHALFDLAHLAPRRFGGSTKLAADKLLPDIPDELLRPGLRRAWDRFVQVVATHIRVEIEPDRHLRAPEQFRRLPWGLRAAKADNPFGIPEGTQIPQIVLWSKMRAAPRSTQRKWFIHPEDFIDEARPKRRVTSVRRAACGSLSQDQREGFLAELAAVCERLWGNPSDHPRPAWVSDSHDGYAIYFYNNHEDRNPSSVIDRNYRKMLIQSSSPEVSAQRYYLPLSANELVDLYLDRGRLHMAEIRHEAGDFRERLMSEWLAGDINPFEGFTWAEPLPRISADSGEARRLFGRLLTSLSQSSRLVAVLSQEGSGKSTAMLEHFVRNTDPSERGFLVFASQSYQQAEEKCEEFNLNCASRGFRGHLLSSFGKVCNRLGIKMTLGEIADSGEPGLLKAVYRTRPDDVAKLEAFKAEFWAEVHATNKTPILFTVHGLIHRWHEDWGTRVWMHPRFAEYMAETGDSDDRDASSFGPRPSGIAVAEGGNSINGPVENLSRESDAIDASRGGDPQRTPHVPVGPDDLEGGNLSGEVVQAASDHLSGPDDNHAGRRCGGRNDRNAIEAEDRQMPIYPEYDNEYNEEVYLDCRLDDGAGIEEFNEYNGEAYLDGRLDDEAEIDEVNEYNGEVYLEGRLDEAEIDEFPASYWTALPEEEVLSGEDDTSGLDDEDCDGQDGALSVKSMKRQMRIKAVIHDELMMDALWWRHPHEAVEWCRGLAKQRGGEKSKSWRDLKLAEKLEVFREFVLHHPVPDAMVAACRDVQSDSEGAGGDEVFRMAREIIDLDYSEDELQTVAIGVEPFGAARSAEGSPFAEVDGCRFYTRTQRWWQESRFSLTILTTEHRVMEALRAIRRKAISEAAAKSSEAPAGTSAKGKPREAGNAERVRADTFYCADLDFSAAYPKEKMVVDLILDKHARKKSSGPDSTVPDVVRLCERIHQIFPDAAIVSDSVGGRLSYVRNHLKTKGSNDLIGKELVGVFLHLAPGQYRNLLLEGRHFGIPDVISLFYVDQFNQTMGRVLGFRHRESSRAIAVMSPNVWSKIAFSLAIQARYRVRMMKGDMFASDDEVIERPSEADHSDEEEDEEDGKSPRDQ